MEILIEVSKYVLGFVGAWILWFLKDWRDKTKAKDELTQTRKLLLVELEAVRNDLGEDEVIDVWPTLECDSHRPLEKGIADLTLQEMRAVDAAYKEICRWNSVWAGNGERYIESSDDHPRYRVTYHLDKAIEELKTGLGIDD